MPVIFENPRLSDGFSPKRILIIRGGAIGDFILTLPVLAALRGKFPDAQLYLLGYPVVANLAVAFGRVDGLRPIESPSLSRFFTSDESLDAEWTSYFSSFNVIISYLYDPDETFRKNVNRCSHAQFIAAPHRPNENESIHATEVFLKPLATLGIVEADPVPRLSLDLRPSPLDMVLAFHPGSGSERKNWPEANWSEFLQRLAKNINTSILLVGGEAEGEKLNRLAAKLPKGKVEVAQNLPLTELARKLQGCSFFVGHDSGISHLAAAIGLPGLILWGQTNERIWRPCKEKMRILQYSGGLSSLPVDRVMTEIISLVEVSRKSTAG